MRRAVTYIALLVIVTVGCDSDKTSTSQNSLKSEGRLVYRGEDGHELTTDELANATGKFNYELVGTRNIPAKANELHQQARQLGAAGEYKQAIELLSQAQSLAPGWPYPTYDIAFTYLLMKDYAKAREHYEKTVKLSPRGFFTALTALDTLNREAAGDLPEGTYAAYASLEWIDDPQRKTKMVNFLVKRFPQFAPAWKEYALLCDDPAEKLDAIEKGLAADPDTETKGILLINKALTLNQQGDKQAAKEILGNLALDPDTTLVNEQLAKQSLSLVAE